MPDETGDDDIGVDPHNQHTPKPDGDGKPGPTQAKLTDRWRRNAEREIIGQNSLDDIRQAIKITRFVADAITRLVGANGAALLMVSEAEYIATPSRSGRRPGSRTQNPHSAEKRELHRRIMLAALLHDDGKPGARGRAIAAAVSGRPPQDRATLQRWLRANFSSARPKGTDKNRP